MSSRINRGRTARASLTAGVSLAVIAAITGTASATDITTDRTVSSQADLDALGGTINIKAPNFLHVISADNLVFSGTVQNENNSWTPSNNYGRFNKGGTGTLTFDGVTMTRGEAYVTGGTLALKGSNFIDYLAVGSGTGNRGAMTIGDGASARFNVTLSVGDWGGTGTVSQTGGTVTVSKDCDDLARCGAMHIGNQGGNGTYTISGGVLDINNARLTIGRNDRNEGNSTGLLEIQGGEVRIGEKAYLTIGFGGELADRAGTASGEIHQTGGVLSIANGSQLHLAGRGTGTYDLDGGTLKIGGNSLMANRPNTTGAYTFNLGGGTIKVDGQKLVTSVNATLKEGTVSTIDTSGLGASWSGQLNGTGGLNKVGGGDLTIGTLSNQISGLRIAEGSVTLDSTTQFGLRDFDRPGPVNTTTTLDLAGGTQLNVNGNFSLGAEDRFIVGIDGNDQAGRIVVNGQADLQGATLEIGANPGLKANHDYTIVSADSFRQEGASDNFTLAPTDFAFVTPELLFGEIVGDKQNLALRLDRDKSFASAALTPNQAAAGNGLDSVGGGALYEALEVVSRANAPAALDAISGEVHASASGVLLNDGLFLRDAVLGRLQYPSKGAATPSVSLASGYAEGEKRSAAPFPGAPQAPVAEANTFWSQAFGSWGHSDSDGNAAKVDRSTGGILVGYDRDFGRDWLLGVAAGYSRTNFDLDDRNSSGNSDNYHLLAYAGGKFADVNVRLGASYTWNDIDTTRNVVLPNYFEQVKADYSAGTTQVFGELGYDVAVGAATKIEPFAGLAYVHLSTDGYSETGGSAALTAASNNQSVTYGTLGLRADHKIAVGNTAVTLQGAAAWQHAWGDVTPTTALAFAGGDAFQVTGAPIAKDALLLKAGFDVDVTAGAKFGLFYAGQIASDAADNSVQGRLSVAF
ncbi:hypothetical protein K32_16940 [Kaistia sp. 32K]|uniref:autotransporter family protein n=1 Tax=Kaistia sp. 32K TaxID=2795690 RepID=UPI001914F305|nr:autotransporter domain-containing protein [Kaistia sp. 32K]BCP53077.1 hypothetical protein K32_16940 [Kaistia sp. 32K]